jgi:hypothetical protein
MSADMLVPNAVSAEFFHTDAGTAFVDLLINGNRETWPIRSKRFRTWLRRRHYEIADCGERRGNQLSPRSA